MLGSFNFQINMWYCLCLNSLNMNLECKKGVCKISMLAMGTCIYNMLPYDPEGGPLAPPPTGSVSGVSWWAPRPGWPLYSPPPLPAVRSVDTQPPLPSHWKSKPDSDREKPHKSQNLKAYIDLWICKISICTMLTLYFLHVQIRGT